VPRRLAFLLGLALAGPLAAQESVVTGLSADEISLNATFDGSELFVFGAVRRDTPPPEDAGPLDVIVTIKGPARPVTVRRKERRFGIWMNTESVEVRQVPSFYAVASTRPVGEILSHTEQLHHHIGMDQAVRFVEGSDVVADSTPFTEAVVRLRERNGSYVRLDDGVAVAEETLFQTRIDLPANLVEGDYLAEFFLVRGQVVISESSTLITVAKTGIERWLYNLSRNEPLLYGLMSVAIALAAGWLAATAFRLGRR
jgi:uncharacterized protein (TIGR02186 family)